MRIPSNIQNTVNVYLAFRAALIAVLEHNKTSKQQIKSVLCPGLGTGVGGLEPEIAAKQMRFAYDAIFASKKSSARAILNEHYCLLN
jgi:O-acetyl-ADP-ribose deacetylase (regulator of RNase III)